MPTPKVSIIICTYNQQDFVRETVDSVVSQTYRNIEVIISDDGSTDATPAILTEYAQRYPDIVKIVLSDRNTGIPANINRGLAIRTGELSAWLDGDDLMLPQKIEKQVAFLASHPEAIGCYHDAEVFDSDSGQVLGRFSQLYNGSLTLLQGRLPDHIKPRYYSIPSSIMCRSEACPSHGFDERMKYLSEFVFFTETFRPGLKLAMDEVLVRYRRHNRNVTSNVGFRAVSIEYELMAYAILEARYPEFHFLWHKMRVSVLLTEAVRCIREGDIKRGTTILWNVWHEGAHLKALSVLMATRLMPLMGGKVSQLTGGQPYNRPDWIKRIARRFLN
jgi:glycosyltransferase involved in cell wall biosynthesis